jgi:cytochrome c-type biogenesis protein CcmH/NrfF
MRLLGAHAVGRRLAIGIAVLLGSIVLAGAAFGQATGPEGWAYALADEIMSPFCPGRTLDECPSPQAESLRLWLIVQDAAGRSRDDVLEQLYDQYGDVIRPAPKAEGIGITAYVLPALVFVAGGVLVAWFLRRQIRDGAVAESIAGPIADPELERIVDEELAG